MLENIPSMLENIDTWMVIRSLGEVFLIYIVVYVVLRIVQGTSGTSILRGLAFTIVLISVGILFFVRKLQLHTIDWLITEFVPVFLIPMIILFQPEFRRALLRLGQAPVFKSFLKPEYQVTNEIIKAIGVFSKNKIGALIAIEREVGLDNFVETGVKINAEVSGELICSLFWNGSPLHDGAVIIQEQRISAAGCLLPLSENVEVLKGLGLGTRHRAAIGLSEETDAIVIVVSEETGAISASIRGVLTRDVDEKRLKKILGEMSSEQLEISGV
ncbi:MAG: diadenylate cyclase CdaA [Candidatus Brocadiaceae bacterium]|nr:diadenylate cyclase CdaA [Candidatus Brocadiaceae bacterium]